MTPPALNPTTRPRSQDSEPFAGSAANLDKPNLEKTLHDKVLIVDFGSQVTQLIARRVREEKVYCEIVPYQKAGEAFRTMKPKAVILSGGPASSSRTRYWPDSDRRAAMAQPADPAPVTM